MATQPTRRRFTTTEYHQMAEAGILGEDDRIELIDGEIVEMTPIGRAHAACLKRLNDRFVREFGDVALVGVQDPIQLDDFTEPQPDLSLLQRRPDFYASHHPQAPDIFLLIEVAQTSADWDRRVKVPLYARSGILEVWLVDIEQETITVYRDPRPEGYRTARVVRRGEQLAPAAFPDRFLSTIDILG